jgi:EAL domain-containing protein (putative c-di-GMP-specific phosphodiesterase class I)
MELIDMASERRTTGERRRTRLSPIEHDLARALERREIEILFQPQFACDDGRVVGAEALARWQHPARGLLGADLLFAIAARAGLVERLSLHIARAALSAAGNWPVPLLLSLNVTAADVAAGDFAQVVARAIADAGFPAEHLTLEITEQVLVADLAGTARRLQDLADLGVRIALDDFGAGFCNFRYLKLLPLHALKLDRSMIEGIDEDPRDLAVLRGILAMARAFGLGVTAEGVEREEQLAVIAREGCSSWQGFLGARPMPADAFAAFAGA